MKLYNTASHQIEEFKPISRDEVKIYTCGPTVYNTPHIGNLASYIYWDLLIRTLKKNGYNVKRVLNLTDVGHLTSDGDHGEDKLEKGARRENKTVWEVAEEYINIFLKNFHALDLTEPYKIARATDYVKQDMAAVDEMTRRGFTYEITDGVYFDTSKFEDYAKFAHLDLDNLMAGARVEFDPEKRNVADFAVWKFIQPGELHAMRWDYLGRPGYPGWHLECSTIIHEELKEPIDIHTGGIDHIPVHHTNEIAQTYALNGNKLSNYWLHCNFITINGERISKSTGNIIALDELIEKGYTPYDYKLWIFQGHYQSARDFTYESLDAAKKRRLNWRNRIAELYQKDSGAGNDDASNSQNTTSDAQKAILDAVSDNLNSASAFAIIDQTEDLTLADWQFIDELFGLNLINDSPKIDAETEKLIEERSAARTAKDWAKSDEIRDQLATKNIAIKDSAAGPVWQYIK